MTVHVCGLTSIIIITLLLNTNCGHLLVTDVVVYRVRVIGVRGASTKAATGAAEVVRTEVRMWAPQARVVPIPLLRPHLGRCVSYCPLVCIPHKSRRCIRDHSAGDAQTRSRDLMQSDTHIGMLHGADVTAKKLCNDHYAESQNGIWNLKEDR